MELRIIEELFSTTNISSFLISIASGATWDAIKKVMKAKDNEDSIEMQVLKIVSNTMRQFYSYKKFTEYDEWVVMKEFCDQYASHCEATGKKADIRSIVEAAIYCELTDNEFNKWIELFTDNCVNNMSVTSWLKMREENEKIFIKRNHVLLRVESKLKELIDDKYSFSGEQYQEVFKCINKLFCNSWKDDLLCLLRKLSPMEYNQKCFADKMEFICSDENCDFIITQVKELLSICNIERIDFKIKNQIFNFLKRPHYDKVLVVTGTPGAGKTFFIEEYIKYNIDLLKYGSGNIVFLVLLMVVKLEMV